MKNILPILLFVLCLAGHAQLPAGNPVYLSNGQLKVALDPAAFSVTMTGPGNSMYEISSAAKRETVSDLSTTATSASWKLKEKGIAVTLRLADGYLDVNITAAAPANFSWPNINTRVNAYTIPFYQGKYIPAQDAQWIGHMVNNGAFSGAQDLSMQFFAINFDDHALVYIIKNMFNNELMFSDNKGTLSLKFNHKFPRTVKDKQFGFRIYLAPNNPIAIARTYKQYIEETGKIVTLAEKAKANPNIKKLYGAPHIYLWNAMFLVAGDVADWKQFKNIIHTELPASSSNPTRHIFSLFKYPEAESGKEFLENIHEFSENEKVGPYFKNILCRALDEALRQPDFYDPAAWKNRAWGSEVQRLLNKGTDQLGDGERYRLNKLLLVAAYPQVFTPVEDWGGLPLAVLDDMKALGVSKAWLGFDSWISGQIHPEFARKAMQMGYLAGPYDDYHGIHEPGHEKWLTATFDDTLLYSKACVMGENGKPVAGFMGEGHMLNPVLALPAVQRRLAKVMKDADNGFNSWFIDCDATGELFDDYSPDRMTTQKDDRDARLKRMAWIRDRYKLVIGSEVGNDFAAGTISFAHGMTTPVIAWSDPDMRKNKNSPYYTGAYYSATGGVPDKFVLQVPLKEPYAYLYYDNRFNVPLFQMVYNNSVITSHHWEWSSLKVPAEIQNNALKEVLYNVPPLYHLDQKNWIRFREAISKHVRVFSKTHPKAVALEMKSFEWLTKDRQVQRTVFGASMEIIANFGEQPFSRKGKTIAGHSLLIHYFKPDSYEVYKP